MTAEEKRYTRQEFLTALENGWSQFLPTIQDWTEEEQEQYVRGEGYDRLQDLLAHICAWWEWDIGHINASMQDSPISEEHPSVDVDEFNATAVEHYRDQEADEVENHYNELLNQLMSRVISLPEDAFEKPDIQRRLQGAAIVHYQEHQPLGGPTVA